MQHPGHRTAHDPGPAAPGTAAARDDAEARERWARDRGATGARAVLRHHGLPAGTLMALGAALQAAAAATTLQAQLWSERRAVERMWRELSALDPRTRQDIGLAR